MADLGTTLLQAGEASLNSLLGAGGTSSGASATPAATTPALTGSAQAQAPANGQGVVATKPINYLPYALAGAVLLGVLIFVAVKK